MPEFRPEIWSDHLFDALRYNLTWVNFWGEDPENPRRLVVRTPIGRFKLLRRRIYLWIWERYTEHGYTQDYLFDSDDGPYANNETAVTTWVDNPNYLPPKDDEVITFKSKGRNHGTDSKDANGSTGSLRQDGVPEL